MAVFNVVMPKMGESIQEATITRWLKQAGDKVEEDDILLEIATDKVDSEIPSPVAGVIASVLFETGAKVPVGEVIAVINLEGAVPDSSAEPAQAKKYRYAIRERKRKKPRKNPSLAMKFPVPVLQEDFILPLYKALPGRKTYPPLNLIRSRAAEEMAGSENRMYSPF